MIWRIWLPSEVERPSLAISYWIPSGIPDHNWTKVFQQTSHSSGTCHCSIGDNEKRKTYLFHDILREVKPKQDFQIFDLIRPFRAVGSPASFDLKAIKYCDDEISVKIHFSSYKQRNKIDCSVSYSTSSPGNREIYKRSCSIFRNWIIYWHIIHSFFHWVPFFLLFSFSMVIYRIILRFKILICHLWLRILHKYYKYYKIINNTSSLLQIVNIAPGKLTICNLGGMVFSATINHYFPWSKCDFFLSFTSLIFISTVCSILLEYTELLFKNQGNNSVAPLTTYPRILPFQYATAIFLIRLQ